MKKLNYLLALALMLVAGLSQAQFDDLYYDPDTDDPYYYNDYDNGDDYYFDDDEYDDYAEYEYWRDYDNYYASRIRRFHRPWVRIGFYNSWAYNSLFFDPFDPFGPYAGFGGSYLSVGFGTPYFNFGFGSPGWNNWGWRNSYWNPGWNNWGWNSWGWNAGWNSWNNWGWNGGFGNPYCPPFYGGGIGYGPGYVGNVVVVNTYNQQSNPKGTYYGSRRSGSTSSSVKGVRDNPRGNVASGERLNPAVRTQDDTRGQGLARSNDNSSTLPRTPRRTDTRESELAVSRWADRPGRTSVIDGTQRGQDRTARRSYERPSRRSVNPTRSFRDSEVSTSRFDRRSYERPTIRSRGSSDSRFNNRSTSPRFERSSPSRSYQNSRGSSTMPRRSATPSRSSSPSRSASPSRSSSSPRQSSSGSSSPRRGG